MTTHKHEVAQGKRFEFGANWARFLLKLNEERVRMAEESLKRMLEVDSLAEKTFLDVGSGSGLFSLAARRIGAKVHSFDYDPQSVACTMELKRRYFPGDADWVVEEGSVLDTDYLKRLGQFDVVYSWGVLHHTGAMWQALENVVPIVGQGGELFIAIYNDQGGWSRRWRMLKRIYNQLPSMFRMPYILITMVPRELFFLFIACMKGRPNIYFNNIRNYQRYSMRGMSYWRDHIDWIGGYPFECAKPEEIFHFFRWKGFQLKRLSTCAGSIGCNEFVFIKSTLGGLRAGVAGVHA